MRFVNITYAQFEYIASLDMRNFGAEAMEFDFGSNKVDKEARFDFSKWKNLKKLTIYHGSNPCQVTVPNGCSYNFYKDKSLLHPNNKSMPNEPDNHFVSFDEI